MISLESLSNTVTKRLFELATPPAPATSSPPLRLHEGLVSTLTMQREAHSRCPAPTYSQRRADLQTLREFVCENRTDLIEAVAADYGCRSRHETLFAEIVPVLDSIDYAKRRLRRWMRPQRRAVDLRLFPGARNRVLPQPLGVVGVMVPWNFPINLSLVPLTFIFAAGNRAMIKLSENSRHLARLMLERIPAYFPPDKLAVFDETGDVGPEFSQLAFDHLLFTGSSQTGRAVMAAAAANLCPVTLELGGKSPAILCADFPLKVAAERILFAKLLNAGQICTSVDHLWMPREKIPEFVALARQIVAQRYSSLSSADYTSIIDARSVVRLRRALREAKALGATVVQLLPDEALDASSRKLAPHLVIEPPDDCELMQREIFGPILPVRGYDRLEEAIESINARPRPLAFYPFSRSRSTVQHLIERVMSGGVSVNDALYHVGQHDLPFGGVGASGMGHYHGTEGFMTFSKLRSVFYQAPVSGMRLLWPPYSGMADKLLDYFAR